MSLGTRLFLSALLLVASVLTGFMVYRLWDRGNPYAHVRTELNLTPARNLDEFEYTDSDGKPLKFADLKGEIYVVNFFWANCPFTCLNFSRAISAMQEEFKDDDVRFLSVTVDPSNDTPERLKKYSDSFGADPKRWTFLTGPLRDTQELGRSLHVSVTGTDHTDELVLVDRDGKIRGAYDHKKPELVAKFKDDVRKLLKEQPRKTERKAEASPQ
jgi:protein SCO1/2